MLAINPKIKQKAEDIRKKILGSEVRESLASGIEAISEDVEATIGRQDYVEEQFQNVIDETTDKDVISAPELIAARNGKSNLKTRLDDEHAQVTAQLQQTEQELSSQLAQNIEGKKSSFYIPTTVPTKGYVTFVDDDATMSVLEKLLPVFSSYNVPMVVAANVDNQNISEPFMTPENLRMLQNEYGWEIANHGYTHVRLDQVTGTDLRHEIVDAHRQLTSYGLSVENIVYPFGAISDEGQALASKYYNSGYVAGGGNVSLPLKNSFGINRIALGSFGGADVLNFDFYKSKVDEAIADNGWTIFMMHAWNPSHDETQQQALKDIIEYCLANNVEIVTLKKGYEVFGNRLEFRGTMAIDGQGLIRDFTGGSYQIVGDNTKRSDSLAEDFRESSITITKIHSTLNNTDGFPITNGQMITLRPGFLGGVEYSTQTIIGINSEIYHRAWKPTTAGGWQPFRAIGSPASFTVSTSNEIIVPGNSYFAFNVSIPVQIGVDTPFVARPSSIINSGISYSVARSNSTNLTITLRNDDATTRNLGVMTWVVKVLE